MCQKSLAVCSHYQQIIHKHPMKDQEAARPRRQQPSYLRRHLYGRKCAHNIAPSLHLNSKPLNPKSLFPRGLPYTAADSRRSGRAPQLLCTLHPSMCKESTDKQPARIIQAPAQVHTRAPPPPGTQAGPQNTCATPLMSKESSWSIAPLGLS